jgi:hypothetical protein
MAFFTSTGWDYVSEQRPLSGLLFVPKMVYEVWEPRWQDTDRGNPKNAKKNKSQCHTVDHKYHMESSGREHVPPPWEAGDCLSHGTASVCGISRLGYRPILSPIFHKHVNIFLLVYISYGFVGWYMSDLGLNMKAVSSSTISDSKGDLKSVLCDVVSGLERHSPLQWRGVTPLCHCFQTYCLVPNTEYCSELL